MQPQFDEGLFGPSHGASGITAQVADWNPFAEDNFGSLTKEDIFAQQLNQQPPSSDNGIYVFVVISATGTERHVKINFIPRIYLLVLFVAVFY